MARLKKTETYLQELKNKGYPQQDKLVKLYHEWKNAPDPDIDALSAFLAAVGGDTGGIRSLLGINTFNNFRGYALEEFCFDLFQKRIKEFEIADLVELLPNQKVLTEEFFVFEKGKFEKIPKEKSIDIVVGQRENELIHPHIIVSCKTYQSTNWLDEDKAIFFSIRNRYPDVVGYSLCLGISTSEDVPLFSRRTGLAVFDLSKKEQYCEFDEDLKKVLKDIKAKAQ